MWRYSNAKQLLWTLNWPVSTLYVWWRHQMETFSASLAICAGNSLVTGSSSQRKAMLDKCFIGCSSPVKVFIHSKKNEWVSQYGIATDIHVIKGHAYVVMHFEDLYWCSSKVYTWKPQWVFARFFLRNLYLELASMVYIEITLSFIFR